MLTSRQSHGLSYTTFALSELKISETPSGDNAEKFQLEVSFNATNIGPVRGSEIAQLYISLPPMPGNHIQPVSQLKGFRKVKDIEPGKTRSVTIKLDKYAVSYWDEGIKSWRAEIGKYGVMIGASSEDIKLRGYFRLETALQWNGL